MIEYRLKEINASHIMIEFNTGIDQYMCLN